MIFINAHVSEWYSFTSAQMAQTFVKCHTEKRVIPYIAIVATCKTQATHGVWKRIGIILPCRIESRVGVLDGYVGFGRFQIVIDEQESNALWIFIPFMCPSFFIIYYKNMRKYVLINVLFHSGFSSGLAVKRLFIYIILYSIEVVQKLLITEEVN